MDLHDLNNVTVDIHQCFWVQSMALIISELLIFTIVMFRMLLWVGIFLIIGKLIKIII